MSEDDVPAEPWVERHTIRRCVSCDCEIVYVDGVAHDVAWSRARGLVVRGQHVCRATREKAITAGMALRQRSEDAGRHAAGAAGDRLARLEGRHG